MEILSCPPVYGISVMHICHNYIYYTLLTSLPTYFATILNFNLHQVKLILIFSFKYVVFSLR